MSYGDYVEQLTYLLFLKMADERTKPPYRPASGAGKSKSIVPKNYDWTSLIKKDAYFRDAPQYISFYHVKAERGDIQNGCRNMAKRNGYN
jgi:hypothetical protein